MCPFCGKRLGKNGGYPRNIPKDASYVDGVILRSYCSRCEVAFSLIPGFILPWHSYSRELIVAWLLERMQGTPFRSQRFLVKQRIEHVPADDTTSWTDMLDSERTCPGYQRFQDWTQRFSRSAQRLLGSLLAVIGWLDIDLRTAAARVATLQPISIPTSPLALAVSLMNCLPRGPDPDQSGTAAELGRLVGLLVMRPLPLSHKIRRASADRIQYDTLVV